MDIENVLYGEPEQGEPVENGEREYVRQPMYPPQRTSVVQIRKRAKAVMARRLKDRTTANIVTILHNVRLIKEV